MRSWTISAACSRSPSASGPTRLRGAATLRAAALERAKRYVDLHLADPELGSAAVARAVGVSERQLQRLFELQGESFARHVARRRLEK